MEPRKLIIVDDIPEVGEFLFDALNTRYHVTIVNSGTAALERLASDTYDVVITDIAMPGMNGDDLIARINAMVNRPVVIAITAYGSVESATRLMKMGAYDYIEKPFTVDRIIHTIDKAFEYGDLRNENRVLHAQLRASDRMPSLVGNSPAIQKIREKLPLVAPTRAAVLITGESGTGKEVVAREIHRLSDRRDRPFIKVNCASIPEALLENELFGVDRPKSSGGAGTSGGKLVLANAGTILLERVGDMPASIQSRLLRLVQDGEVERPGREIPVEADVRVIATSDRPLNKEVKSGKFREDLFYRLNVVPIDVPPLRERREDIPLLIGHFLERFCQQNGRAPVRITDRALAKLGNGYWRGNVRELENVIERAVILANGATLDEGSFLFDDDHDETFSRIEQTFLFGSVREMERLMIGHRLEQLNQNRTRTARTLDISVRTLRNKLREYRELANGVHADEVLIGRD